jgi:hypothetical protein
VHTKRFGDRGTGDVGIENANLVTLSLQKNSKHRGDQRFTNAALAADNSNNVLYIAERICGNQQALGLLARGAIAGASRAIMRTFRHFLYPSFCVSFIQAILYTLFVKKQPFFAKNLM